MSEPFDSCGILEGLMIVMERQLVDSTLESTRVFWRKEFFGATEEEARDPRPFAEVLRDRQE